MLNPNHPRSKSIIQAALHLDEVLIAMQKLAVETDPDGRLRIVDALTVPFDELQKLGADQFAGKKGIAADLETVQQTISELASAPVICTQPGRCPACASELHKAGYKEFLCDTCFDRLDPALWRLKFEDGFETDGI